MAQYRLNTYDADVFIPEFKGLMEYGDQMGTDLRYSPGCLNVETPGGVLQPAPGMKHYTLYDRATGERVRATQIGQMMYFRPTNNTGSALIFEGYIPGHNEFCPAGYEYNVYLFFVDDYIYAVKTRSSIEDIIEVYGQEITHFCADKLQSRFSAYGWNYCTYEHTFNGNEFQDIPAGRTNVLIFASSRTGMVYLYAGTGQPELISRDSDPRITPAKFRFVARYAERIWGAGAEDHRDSIYYSAPYNALDWEQNSDIPEDGGGEIREPMFDDDYFTALVPFGGALIAFTKYRAWKITGTDPSNFMIQEQYGCGTRFPGTIAVMDEHIIMLGEDSLLLYDGISVTPFLKEQTTELFRKIKIDTLNPSAILTKPELTDPIAVRYKEKYILCMANRLTYSEDTGYPFDNGYYYLVYDEADRSLNKVESPKILSLCSPGSCLYGLLYDHIPNDYPVPSERGTPYNAVAIIRFDSWYHQSITSLPTRWVTPWITLGRTDIQKGGFDVYFTPEIPIVANDGVTFSFVMETEKKVKRKSYTVQPHFRPGDPIVPERYHTKYKAKRLHFGGSGRRFRLTIETAGGYVPWRLIGGIHIIAETDPD